jgi:hypothetical protein
VYQKNLTEFGQTTQVHPPLWLLSNLAENDLFNVTLVQIGVSICERKKAEHLVACDWALEKPVTMLRRLSLDSSQQYFLTTLTVNPSLGV